MPINPLHSPPFDVVRCDDPRIQLRCPAVADLGGARTIAQAATAGNPAIRDAETQLRAWATQTATATLDQLAEELLEAWHARRTINARRW